MEVAEDLKLEVLAKGRRASTAHKWLVTLMTYP